jgi:hypothetical protein
MPLTIKEVLETLEDPVALGIDFYADKIHVKGEYPSRVHERIVVGDILVTGGTSEPGIHRARDQSGRLCRSLRLIVPAIEATPHETREAAAARPGAANPS